MDSELREILTSIRSWEEADRFFDSLEFVHLLHSGSPGNALLLGIESLEHCQRVAPDAYQAIHKGSPFYWLGMAAFLVHDYETAVFFFDAGVAEDLRKGNDPVNNSTPGFRFVQIEGDNDQQAALQLVRLLQAKVEASINDYNARPGRPAIVTPLDLQAIRQRFLRRSLQPGGEQLRTLATAFISFFLEWEHVSRLAKLRPAAGSSEPMFIHLFKGCLLFESLLKNKPSGRPRGSTLGPILQELQVSLGIPNDIRTSGTLPEIIQGLAGADDSLPTALEFTARARNTIGHDLGWANGINAAEYEMLVSMVARSCLHAIACVF